MIKLEKLNLCNVAEYEWLLDLRCGYVLFKNGLGLITAWKEKEHKVYIILSRKCSIEDAFRSPHVHYWNDQEVVNYLCHLSQLEPKKDFCKIFRELSTLHESYDKLPYI